MDESSSPVAAPFMAFRHRVFTESLDPVECATVPIAFLKDGDLTLDRTGVLLAIGDNHFVITAEHELEEIFKAGYSPVILPGTPTGRPIPMLDDRMIVSHDPRIDIAVFRLEASIVPLAKKEYRFLRLDNVRLHAPTTDEGPFFLVTGFPQANLTRDDAGRKRVDIGRYLTMRYEGDYKLVEDFVPTTHIVLEYSRDSNHTSGHTGPPPKAPGLSGCGIWYLPIPRGMEAWSSSDLKLVGIQTAWYPHQFLKGTIISHALSMIWGWFSDVRDAMRLHGIAL